MNILIYSKNTKSEYFLVPICGHSAFVRKGISSRPHIHPVYHIMFATRGEAFLENDYGKHYVHEKDIYIVHPNERHILSTSYEDGFTYFSFNFYLLTSENYKKLSISDEIETKDNRTRIEAVAETERLDRLFDFKINDVYFDYDKSKWSKINSLINISSEVTKNYNNKILGNFGNSDAKDHLEWSNCFAKFFWDFYSIIAHDSNESSLNEKDKILLNKISKYLMENVHEKFSLSELSTHLNYNPIYICTYFKRKTGYTISQFFNKLKILKACEYLRTTDKSITEIASLLNFSSSNHFSRNFKEVKFISPRDYRRHLEID